MSRYATTGRFTSTMYQAEGEVVPSSSFVGVEVGVEVGVGVGVGVGVEVGVGVSAGMQLFSIM